MVDARKYVVSFLCTGNSARSIIAEAIMNTVGADRFQAYSVGSRPNRTINRHALALLKRLDFPTKSFRSKPWGEFSRPDKPRLDFIITVCDNAAGEVCPIWPSQPMTAHWGMPDPAAVDFGFLGSVGRSATEPRFFRFATVFGLTP
jgi:arsenate reductase